MDYEKKLKEVIKIKISNLNQDEEFVIKVRRLPLSETKKFT